jgi:hypothetical protein
MIQFSTLMWASALFFGVIGFLRGWNRELIATAGITLAMFGIFQFDSVLRGTVFLLMPREQVFLLQAAVFSAIVLFVYQAKELAGTTNRSDDNLQSGFLGILAGAFNGYLIIGSLWYLLDINEYPLTQFMIAPGPNSPSAQALNMMPLVLIGGGTSGTGDLLAVLVVALLFFVLVMN